MRAVEAQSSGGRDLVEQRLLHERVREPVAHGRAAQLVEQPGDTRRFERVDHLLLGVAGDRDDHVELEVLARDRGTVQHGVARVGQCAESLADNLLDAFGDPDLFDAYVGSPYAVGVLIDRAAFGEAHEHLDREEGIAAGLGVQRRPRARAIAR